MNYEDSFIDTARPHILMITNHGVHQWRIIPGLPDTGGQNVFVNQFTQSLADEGYKITIANRGGYEHPVSREMRIGIQYKDEYQRILYLEDDTHAFVRKEDMDENLPLLAQNLQDHLEKEGLGVDLIVSHYWDGAKLGVLFNQLQKTPFPHIWVPHSLGAIKKRQVKPDQWDSLHIDERIRNEETIIQKVSGIAATSDNIERSLVEDYDYHQKPLFLPPCIDQERFFPRDISGKHPIWNFLSGQCRLSPEEVRQSQIITEISRTDSTKRKGVLIRAFAKIQQQHPNTLLVVSIEQTGEGLGKDLKELILELGIENRVAILGSVWDKLPDIYAVTDIYCTPSIMEGFGMTSQEAAATAVPVVASHLVPFVTEYLLGEDFEEVLPEEDRKAIRVGQGAIVVQAEDVDGFAYALDLLLSNPDLRNEMGEQAYQITIPYFTWNNVVQGFLKGVDQRMPGGTDQ